jgi:hypothetical protein
MDTTLPELRRHLPWAAPSAAHPDKRCKDGCEQNDCHGDADWFVQCVLGPGHKREYYDHNHSHSCKPHDESGFVGAQCSSCYGRPSVSC